MIKNKAKLIITSIDRKLFTFLLSLAFVTVVVSLPFILPVFTPCLQNTPGIAYRAKDCNAATALDLFLATSLVLFALVTLGIYVLNKDYSRMIIVALPALLAIITVIIYYQYAPLVNQQVHRAPIELSPDSFEDIEVIDK